MTTDPRVNSFRETPTYRTVVLVAFFDHIFNKPLLSRYQLLVVSDLSHTRELCLTDIIEFLRRVTNDGDLERIKEGLQLQTNILLNTCAQGSENLTKRLLGMGAGVTFVNETGRTPLTVASTKGHADIVKTLLNSGADFNVTDNDGCQIDWRLQ
jgi:hypothetical protein